ncbi:MAG: hypothetical protein VYA34_03430 [Myxococcota bacterium]|nr:hypothetical protein [Myxococcota bacterium]
MSNTRLNPTGDFDAKLLQKLDARDSNTDGVIKDLNSSEVKETLAKAGITDTASLDKWDGKFDGQIDLTKIRNPEGAKDWFSSSNTHFQNRTNKTSRNRVYQTIVGARDMGMDRRGSELSSEISDWSNLSRINYNKFFKKGLGYNQASNPLTKKVAEIDTALLEMKDPAISEVLKKQSTFFKHINNSITNRASGRTDETAKAIELLAEMKTSVSKLGPEHAALKQQLTKDMADFENLLLNFANVAHLAESRMGQTVNSADNQLAPYFVKTLYRYSADIRRSRPHFGATVQGAIDSYQKDIKLHLHWMKSVNEIRANRGAFSSLKDYQEAISAKLKGGGKGLVEAAVKMAKADWQTANAGIHLQEADKAIKHGSGQVTLANAELDKTKSSLVDGETNIWKADRALKSGKTGPAQEFINQLGVQLKDVDRQLATAQQKLTNAKQSADAADAHLKDASTELKQASDITLSVRNGTYGRRLNTQLSSIESEIKSLSSLKTHLTNQHKRLVEDISATTIRHKDLNHGVAAARSEGQTIFTAAQKIEIDKAEQAYLGALDRMMDGDTLKLSEKGLAALINSAADENGEYSRVDFRIGGGVAARGNIGIVGGRAWVQGMLSTGVSVKRGDSDDVEVAIDFAALINAGVEVEALFGLIGAGVESTVDYEKRVAFRFANSEDAARFLMQKVYAPILRQARNKVPTKAKGKFDQMVQTGPYSLEPPKNPILRVSSHKLGSAVSGRIRGGIPGVASARAKGGVSASKTWVELTDAKTGRKVNTQEVTNKALFFEFGAGRANAGSFNVKGEIAWQDTANHPDPSSDGRHRDWNLTVTLGGTTATTIAKGGKAAIADFAGEILGVQPPFSPEKLKAAGVTSQVFEGVQGAVASQLARIKGVDSDIALTINIHEQDVGGKRSGEPKYQVQFTRASIKYSSFAGVGSGSLKDAGGKLAPGPGAVGTHFTAGFGYEREEVIAEIINGGNQAAENYILQNAASYEEHGRFASWAGRHRTAIATTFRSKNYDNNIPANASVTINGVKWDAKKIKEFRQELPKRPGVLMGGDKFFTMTKIMYQLEHHKAAQRKAS